MSHVLVTGAQGFIGQLLVQRLLRTGLGGRPVERLSLLDTAFAHAPADPRVQTLAGSIADPALRERALAEPVDLLFHLASVPGGAAERDYALGRDVNLLATLGLLEGLRAQPRPPRFVFASSIAVYGDALPAEVTEDTRPSPGLSYGAHKLAAELLVADATRRGWVQGLSLRLPGLVARPGTGDGLLSAFMSQLFWRLRDGQPLTVPVGPQGTAWWMSALRCVDNLLHAATVDTGRLQPQRSYTLPVLRLSMQQLVDALCARFGADRAALVRWAPDPQVERLFAAYPPLRVPEAEALGFRHDGDIDGLIDHALDPAAAAR